MLLALFISSCVSYESIGSIVETNSDSKQTVFIPEKKEVNNNSQLNYYSTSPCDLKPDAGNCRAMHIRYYYDPVEKKCKQFIYGGCDGVVPFRTLEECKKSCGCN